MSATAALETSINEAFIAQNGSLRDHLSTFEETFWGKRGVNAFRSPRPCKAVVMAIKRWSLGFVRDFLGLRSQNLEWMASRAAKRDGYRP